MFNYVHYVIGVTVMTAVILCTHTVIVLAWSGTNAYSIVLLANIDTDEHLWNAFYDGAFNTTLELYADDVRVMQGEASRSLSNDDDFLKNIENRNIVDKLWIPRDHYPYLVRLSNEWMVLDVPVQKYKTMFIPAKSNAENRMKNKNNSDDTNYHKNGNAVTINSNNVVLLHCRLPLPQTREEVQLRRSQFIKTESSRFQMMLMNWWRSEANKRASHCLFGDGEGVFTLTPRFYDLCPLEHIWRVRHVALYKALWLEEQVSSGPYALMNRTSSNHSSHRTSNRFSNDKLNNWSKNEKGHVYVSNKITKTHHESSEFRWPHVDPHNETVTSKITSFLREMHTSLESWQEVMQSNKYTHAFQKIGTFHSELSRPRWNAELHVWEMLYPSLEPCYMHYTSLTSNESTKEVSTWLPSPLSTLYKFFESKVNGDNADNESKEEMKRVTTFTEEEEAKREEHEKKNEEVKPLVTWRTIVKFRCPSTSPYSVSNSADVKNGKNPSSIYASWADEMQNRWRIKHWTVTEVRQMCRYEFEIASDIVCEWEQELDKLNVNAIPCDEIS